MLFRKCSKSDLIVALSKANEEYEGNLRLIEGGRTGLRFRLGVHDGHKIGARTSARGRCGPFASWEAHRDFFRALFAHNDKAIVVTGLVRRNGVPAYTAENFEDTFPDTAYINIGSQMEPTTMPDQTVDPRDYIKTRIDPAAIPRRAKEAREIRRAMWPRLSLGEFDNQVLNASVSNTHYQHVLPNRAYLLVDLFKENASTMHIVEAFSKPGFDNWSKSAYPDRLLALRAFINYVLRKTALDPDRDRIPVELPSPL